MQLKFQFDTEASVGNYQRIRSHAESKKKGSAAGLLQEQETLGYLNEEDVFGDITFVLGGAACASIFAESEEVILHRLEKQKVRSLLDGDPLLERGFYHLLASIQRDRLVVRQVTPPPFLPFAPALCASVGVNG